MFTLADIYNGLEEMVENGPVYMNPYVSQTDLMNQKIQMDKPVDLLIDDYNSTYTVRVSFNGEDIIGMEDILAENFHKILSGESLT